MVFGHLIAAKVHLMAASKDFGGGFKMSDALLSLLTVETLLFAALGIAASFAAGEGSRVRNMPVSGEVLGGAAVFVLALVALGAVMAWGNVFLPFPHPADRIIIAGSLLLAIIAQPVIAVLLAVGLR
jgi:hypothetical protein